jgi:D-alanyl-D-alanine carboxypeptidase
MAVFPVAPAGRGPVRSFGIPALLAAAMLMLMSFAVAAAPFASMVMDARTGQVLHSENADTRLHPASLTKMMTLYIAFEAIERGEISLDTLVTVTAHAANEPPSKLGLRAGQKIKLRYLIRAAAIKSANDAATAIGEAIGGSEADFARRMNRTAAALGMTRTTFKNANGLTEQGHLSTARDMTLLGRRLFYDHPSFYNLFSRRTSDAGGRTVANTNTRLLDAYPGADGIKTGYTVAAGFNLVASAQRGNERIIATVFGGTSTAARNAKIAELLDLGFRKAPSNVREKKPQAPAYSDVETAPQAPALVAEAEGGTFIEGSGTGLGGGKIVRVNGAPARSRRPLGRPGAPPALLAAAPVPAAEVAAIEEPPAEVLTAMRDDIEGALAEALNQEVAVAVADAVAPEPIAMPDPQLTLAALARAAPPPRPQRLTPSEAEVELAEVADAAQDAAQALVDSEAAVPDDAPVADAAALVADAASEAEPVSADLAADAAPLVGEVDVAMAAPEILPEVFPAASEPTVVTRLSTSGGRNWGINVGTYGSAYEAERVLLKTALMEIGTLDEALRKVAKGKTGFDANFLGMTEDLAGLACARLAARNVECRTLGPSG